MTISVKSPYDANATPADIDLDLLNVSIGYHGTTTRLIPLGDGVYADTLGLVPVIADSTYTLTFNFNGKIINSTTIVPPKPASVAQSVTYISMSQIDLTSTNQVMPPAPVEITFANKDNSYYIATVECVDTGTVSIYKDSIPANDMFSSMPVTGTRIDIHPMRLRYFGMNRIILYHINPEYSTFFMQQASTSQSYQEPPSNITNGLGIFTGVNADTLYLNVIQVK